MTQKTSQHLFALHNAIV